MAWTAPATAVSNSLLTASWLNTYLRDNLLETAPAKATEGGQLFTSSAPNTIVAKTNRIDYISTSQTTTSTSYVDLATVGPTVTFTFNAFAVIRISGQLSGSTASTESYMSFAVSGATTLAAADTRAVAVQGTDTKKYTYYVALDSTSLNAGSNTLTAKYKSSTGTATFADRELSVISL